MADGAETVETEADKTRACAEGEWKREGWRSDVAVVRRGGNGSRLGRAEWVAGLYLVVAAVYIYYSDRIVGMLAGSAQEMTRWATYKGWGYVVVTAGLLWVVLRRLFGRLEANEERLKRLNRELKAVSECGQAIVRARDEGGLLREVCRIICETAGHRMAWVGMAEEGEEKRVRPVAWAGAELGYLSEVRTTWGESEWGRGPMGRAIRSGKSAYMQSFAEDPLAAPWREAALSRGYEGAIGLPLVGVGAMFRGVLMIYAGRREAFIPEEVRLLEELAEDLAFGMSVLRIREERREAEEALRESEARFRSLIEQAMDGVFLVDRGGVLVEANEAGCRMLGYEAGELKGKSATELLEAGDHERLRRALEQVVGGQTHMEEWVLIGKDGAKRVTEVSARWLSGGQVVAFVRDITQRREIEEVARRQQMEIAHLSRIASVGEMASSLAHELNQPLTVILGYAGVCLDMVRSSPGAWGKMSGHLEAVCNQAKRAGEIIRRLRAYARKQQEVQRQLVEINPVVREAVEMMRFELRRAGVEAQLALAEGLPAVLIDPVQIQQVLTNWLQNALEAMEGVSAGERRLLLRTGLAEEGGVRVSMTDGGRGVEPEVAERMFESFFTTKPRGLGLGLAICRSIIEMHGGQITAKANADRGMTFEFVLPVGSRD